MNCTKMVLLFGKCGGAVLEVTENTIKRLSIISDKLRCLCLHWHRFVLQAMIHCIAQKISKTIIKLPLYGWPLTGDYFNLTFNQCINNNWRRNALNFKSSHTLVGSCQTGVKYLCSEGNMSDVKALQTLFSCLYPIKILKILHFNFKFKD